MKKYGFAMMLVLSLASTAAMAASSQSLPLGNSKLGLGNSKLGGGVSTVPADALNGNFVSFGGTGGSSGLPGNTISPISPQLVEGWSSCNSHRVLFNGQSDPNGPWTAIDLVVNAGPLINYRTSGFTVSAAPLTFEQIQFQCSFSMKYMWCQNSQIGLGVRPDGYEVTVGPDAVPMFVSCHFK